MLKGLHLHSAIAKVNGLAPTITCTVKAGLFTGLWKQAVFLSNTVTRLKPIASSDLQYIIEKTVCTILGLRACRIGALKRRISTGRFAFRFTSEGRVSYTQGKCTLSLINYPHAEINTQSSHATFNRNQTCSIAR